jgi:O-antigen/teichoic acid export membrane protein
MSIMRVGQVALSALATVLLTRSLGINDYGSYALITTIISTISIPIQFGLYQYVVRSTSAANAAHHSPRSVLSKALFVAFSWSFFGAIVLLVIAQTLARQTTHAESTAISMLAVVILFLSNTQHTLGAYLTGLGTPLQSQAIDGLVRPLIFLVLLGAFFLFTEHLISLPAVLEIQVASVFATFLFYFSCICRSKQKSISNHQPANLLTYSLPTFMLIGVLDGITQNIDLIILGFTNSQQHVACYRVALLLISLMGIPFGALNSIASQQIASMADRPPSRILYSQCIRSTRIAFGAVFSGYVCFLIIGPAAIPLLFGPEFTDAYLNASILGASVVVNTAFGLNKTMLTMMGHETIVLKILLVCTLFNIVICIPLALKFGSIGCAFATLLSMMVWNLCLSVTCKRLFGTNLSIFER